MARYIIWIEGIEYKDGDKIKSINEKGITYTTRMMGAMRINKKDIPKMREWMREHHIADWVINGNTFIKTNYTPKGTLYTFT